MIGDIERLLTELTDAGVRYIVVGGVAVAWLCPGRYMAGRLVALALPRPGA